MKTMYNIADFQEKKSTEEKIQNGIQNTSIGLAGASATGLGVMGADDLLSRKKLSSKERDLIKQLKESEKRLKKDEIAEVDSERKKENKKYRNIEKELNKIQDRKLLQRKATRLGTGALGSGLTIGGLILKNRNKDKND